MMLNVSNLVDYQRGVWATASNRGWIGVDVGRRGIKLAQLTRAGVYLCCLLFCAEY